MHLERRNIDNLFERLRGRCPWIVECLGIVTGPAVRRFYAKSSVMDSLFAKFIAYQDTVDRLRICPILHPAICDRSQAF